MTQAHKIELEEEPLPESAPVTIRQSSNPFTQSERKDRISFLRLKTGEIEAHINQLKHELSESLAELNDLRTDCEHRHDNGDTAIVAAGAGSDCCTICGNWWV